jgi:bacteriorhodopsin
LFRRALSTVILPVTIATTSVFAALEHGSVRVYWSIGTVAAVLIAGVISFAKERNAVTVREKAIGLSAHRAHDRNSLD